MNKQQILSKKNLTKSNVTVNFRNLIDKLLGRYKGGVSSVFRELLMNADDAGASKTRVFLDQKNKRIMIGNDSKFSEEDWKRLSSIADGNPSENSIGCFGVGFYSVFSICDEPIVQSGDSVLLFLWKDTTLTTVSSKIEKQEKKEKNFETEIILDYEKNSDFQIDINSWIETLKSLLLFTKNVTKVYFEDSDKNTTLLISKKYSNISAKKPNPKVKSKFFQIKEWKTLNLEINTKEMNNSNNKKNENLIFKQVTGDFNVFPTDNLKKKILGIFKKEPPKTVTISLIFDSLSTGQKNLKTTISPMSGGRIFIGAQTHQTTGNFFHTHTSFLPTVEREDIDFNLEWNTDLSFVLGKFLRNYYDNVCFEDSLPFEEKVFLFNCLGLEKTSPSKELGTFIEKGFFEHDENDLYIPNQFYFEKVSKLYVPQYKLEALIFEKKKSTNHLKIFPFEILQQKRKKIFGKNWEFISILKRKKILKTLTLENILDHLETFETKFSFDQILTCLKWLESCWKKFFSKNSNTSVINLDDENDENDENEEVEFKNQLFENKKKFFQVLGLDKLKYYGGEEIRYSKGNNECLDFEFFQEFNENILKNEPFNLIKIPFKNWIQWMKKETDTLEKNKEAAKVFLENCSKNFYSFTVKEKKTFLTFWKTKKIIPTEDGRLKIPEECFIKEEDEIYQKNDNIQNNLNFVEKEIAEKAKNFLLEIGVKSSPPAALILETINNFSLNWNNEKIIDYLMKQKLQQVDLNFLKTKKFLKNLKNEIFAPCSLYLDTDINKILDFPILKTNIILSEDQKNFLKKIGILEHPDLNTLLLICSDISETRRNLAMKHFFENFEDFKKEYKKMKNIPSFLLCTNLISGEKQLSSPENCFSEKLEFSTTSNSKKKTKIKNIDKEEVEEFVTIANKESLEVIGSYFNWLTLEEELYGIEPKKIGVQNHPKPESVIEILRSKPPTKNQLGPILCYLGQYSSDFTPKHFQSLKDLAFIRSENGCLLQANQVFEKTDKLQEIYGSLLEWIDLSGVPENAKNFLRSCGLASHPSINSICEALLQNAENFLKQDGLSPYLKVLNIIASSFDQIPQKKKTQFQKSANFPGIRFVSDSQTSSIRLYQAKSVYLNDNSDYERIFKPPVAPHGISKEVENLYSNSGSQWLSTSVKEKTLETSGKSSRKCKEFEDLIQSRRPLFLIDLDTSESRQGMKKNAKKLLEKLKILECSKITKSLSLSQQKVTIETVCSSSGSNIYMTETCQVLAIAKQLVNILMEKPSPKTFSEFHTYLSSSESELRECFPSLDRFLPKKNLFNYHNNNNDHFNLNNNNNFDLNNNNNFEDDNEKIEATKAPELVGKKMSIDEAIKSQKSFSNSLLKNPTNIKWDFLDADEFEKACDSDYYHTTKLFHIGTSPSRVKILEAFHQGIDTKLWNDYQEEFQESVEAFEELLFELFEIFKIKGEFHKVVSIFLDSLTSTIAFNYANLLHFNLCFFDQAFFRTRKSRSEALCFYFTTFCHEIAHNLVSEHNVHHGHTTEALVSDHLLNLLPKLIDSENSIFVPKYKTFKIPKLSSNSSNSNGNGNGNNRKEKKSNGKIEISKRKAKVPSSKKGEIQKKSKLETVDLTED